MFTVHPTRMVRFQLLTTLLGVSIPFAVESLVTDYSIARLIATIAFFMTALNFFHGKVVTLEDEDYNLALVNRPALALADFVLNTLVILSFVFMAFLLGNAEYLLSTNIVVRLLDIVLVLLVQSISAQKVIRRAQSIWLFIDYIAILWLGWCLVLFAPVEKHAVEISIAFLVLVLFDISLDYSLNRKLYFSIAATWGELADYWDALQGDRGDIYRQAILLPAILQTVGSLKNKRVLDLGCGNGCVPRVLADQGAKVVGVDRFETMLRVALKYKSPNVVYHQIDIASHAGLIDAGNYDWIIACFSLQDCDHIANPLRLAAKNLAPSGRHLVIFENDRAFSIRHEHTTSRRHWLDSPKLAGKGRRQLIMWNPELAQDILDTRPGDYHTMSESALPKDFITVSRHWSESRYLSSAREAGFELVMAPMDLPITEEYASNETLALYSANPRFRMMIFKNRRKEQPAMPANHRGETPDALPLLLISGVSGSGKTSVAAHLPNAVVVSVDDFYLDVDDPAVPRKRGEPDWDSIDSVNMDALKSAVENLLRRQITTIPRYDMKTSRRYGSHTIDPQDARVIAVEGLFAFDLFSAVPSQIFCVLIASSSPWLFFRRLSRDLHEGRHSLGKTLWNAIALSFRDRNFLSTVTQQADYVFDSMLAPEVLASKISQLVNC